MYTMNEATIYKKRGSYAINILGLSLFQYAVTDSISCLANSNTGTDWLTEEGAQCFLETRSNIKGK